jgi:hypothetical protein
MIMIVGSIIIIYLNVMMSNVSNNLLTIHALKMILNVGKLKHYLKHVNGMIGIVG